MLEGKIFLGIVAKKTVLAVPLGTDRYRISTRGRFVAKESIVKADEVTAMPGLRPVK